MTVADATAATIASLEYPSQDPRSTIGLVAMRIAGAFDENPSASVARELRQCLEGITAFPNDAPGAVDEILERRLARRVDDLIHAAEVGL